MSLPIQSKANSIQNFSEDQVTLIKSVIAKDATDDELKLFLYTANKSGLDPLAKQMYFQKRKNNKTGKDTVVFITSIDGYRLIASRTGAHAGTDDAVFELDRNGHPIKATVTVYKFVSGAKVAFSASARWSEYCPSAGQDYVWQKMPFTMLAKCAEALALRKAFPNDLSNLYIKEEMDQSGDDDNSSQKEKKEAVDGKTKVLSPSASQEEGQRVKRGAQESPVIKPSQAQLKMVFAKCVNELGKSTDEAVEFLQTASGMKDRNDWTLDTFKKVLETIETKAAEIKANNPQKEPLKEGDFGYE